MNRENRSGVHKTGHTRENQTGITLESNAFALDNLAKTKAASKIKNYTLYVYTIIWLTLGSFSIHVKSKMDF